MGLFSRKKRQESAQRPKSAKRRANPNSLTLGGVNLSLEPDRNLVIGNSRSTDHADTPILGQLGAFDDLTLDQGLLGEDALEGFQLLDGPGVTPGVDDEPDNEPPVQEAPEYRDVGMHLADLDDVALDYRGNKQKKAMKLLASYRDFVATGETPGPKQIKQVERAQEILREILGTKHKKKTRDKNWEAFSRAAERIVAELDDELILIQSRVRMDELTAGGELESGSFHGTHSGLLRGLEAGNSHDILPAAELERRGIIRSSGEGDFFSSGGTGEKEFVSIGVGELGLGTALSYAIGTNQLQNYNTENYTDEELLSEIESLNDIVDNWDEALVAGLSESDVKTRGQFTALRDKLVGEHGWRKGLPADHPRRRGKASMDSNFPLFIEIDTSGLDVRDDGDLAQREKGNAEGGFYGDLPGERMVYGGGGIDLQVRLKRVWAPLKRMSEASSRLSGIVGHSDFEVLALESLTMVHEGTHMRGAQIETSTQLKEFEATRKSLITAYAEGMRSGEPITSQKVVSAFKAAKG